MEDRTKLFDAIRLGRTAKAEASLLRMMDEHPEDLWSVGAYADRMFQTGHYGLSFHLYSHLLKEWKDCPPEYRIVFWANIAYALHNAGRDEEAEMAFQKGLEIGKHQDVIYNYRAMGHVNKAEPEKVIEYCDKALAINPDLAAAKFNRSIGYLELSRWKEGWEGYSNGERREHPRSYHDDKTTQEWDGKRNRTVVVWGEQGVGDEVMFGSCLPDMIQSVDKVILDCHPRLEKTWRRSFPDLTIYPTRKMGEITWHRKEKIDKQVSIADLGRFFRNEEAAFPGTPFIKVDPERVAFYRKKLEATGHGPYVGIAWFGGEKKTRFDFRSIPLNLWKPIRDEGGTFVSIQYNKWGHRKEAQNNGIPEWEGYYGNNGPIEDLDEMFSLIQACDLIISVCQTAIHMAGAIGKECWCLTPSRPAWRYGLKSDRMVWYNSVNLIRQGKDESWESVIARTAERYKAWKAGRSADVQGERSGGAATVDGASQDGIAA